MAQGRGQTTWGIEYLPRRRRRGGDFVVGGGVGINLSASSFLANAAQGTAIGTLSVVGGTGTYTFTLTDSHTNAVQVAGTNGVNLQVGASVSSAGAFNITVHADNGTGSTLDRTFSISATQAPANTIAPTISGSAVDGVTLSADNGTWTGFPSPSFTYQWKRAGVAITGATNSTYTLQAADVGSAITVTVTGTNSVGNASATSSATGTVTKTTLSYSPVTSGLNGSAYTGATPSTSNGTSPYTYSISAGTLPAGTSLNTSTGVISGTPTTSTAYPGIVLRVTDANGITDSSASFTITISDPGVIPAPSLVLEAASDSGSSSSDDITSATTPTIDIIFSQLPLAGDVINIKDNGTQIVSHTVTSGEAGSGTIALGLSALSEGAHSLTAQHVSGTSSSAFSSALGITILTTAPTVTTAATANNAENSTLAISLTATAPATSTFAWSITGGADQVKFEISGTTLRWASNGTQNFEAPADADTNNTYIVQVTATDLAGNAGNKTITVTVTDVNEAPTLANAIPNQNATVSNAFSFQFASNTFTDPDAGDTATYSATQTGGAALPAWLTFTPSTRTFSGTPAIGDVGTIHVTVTDTDSGGLSGTASFDITVGTATARTSFLLRSYVDAETIGSRQWISGDGTYVVEN